MRRMIIGILVAMQTMAVAGKIHVSEDLEKDIDGYLLECDKVCSACHQPFKYCSEKQQKSVCSAYPYAWPYTTNDCSDER